MIKGISSQNVSDIFLFRDHIDPQLRGAVRSLAANFIKTVSHSSEDGYDKWLKRCVVPEIATMFQGEALITIFVQVMTKLFVNASNFELLGFCFFL